MRKINVLSREQLEEIMQQIGLEHIDVEDNHTRILSSK